MPRVWLVSGEKGGIGKSLFSMTLASFLQGQKRRVAVVDFDFRNADVIAGDLRIRINLNQSVNVSVGEYEDLKLLEPSTEVVVNTLAGPVAGFPRDSHILNGAFLLAEHSHSGGD